MLKRQFALLTAVAMTALLGLLSPTTAAFADAPTRSSMQKIVLPAEDVTVASSPDCSEVGSWGKIRYQVCQRWNCDSKNCYHRGFLGLVNKAESRRVVDWKMAHQVDGGEWWDDGQGTVPLAALEAKEGIFSPITYFESCGITVVRRLAIRYDSAGWSPYVYVTSRMPCV